METLEQSKVWLPVPVTDKLLERVNQTIRVEGL